MEGDFGCCCVPMLSVSASRLEWVRSFRDYRCHPRVRIEIEAVAHRAPRAVVYDGAVLTVGAHSAEKKTSFVSGIMLFLRQVVGELRKVVTPTRSELVRYTVVVLMFVAVMIAIATVLDLAFGAGAAFVFGGGSGDH